MRIGLTFTALIYLAGCAAGQNSTADVFDVNGRCRVEFDGRSMRVLRVAEPGEPEQLVWSRPLTTAERRFLAERINDPALRRLDGEYDSEIWDGYSLGFSIRQRGRAAFGVSVANERVDELVRLADAMDVMLPEEHRINYRQQADEQAE